MIARVCWVVHQQTLFGLELNCFLAFQVSAPISVVALRPLVYPPSPWLPSPFLELARRPSPLSPRPLSPVKGTGAKLKSLC